MLKTFVCSMEFSHSYCLMEATPSGGVKTSLLISCPHQFKQFKMVKLVYWVECPNTRVGSLSLTYIKNTHLLGGQYL